ncbi:MAG TPA: regulatory protein RecX [Rugosimonospora sp.]|nr:regulatory protein RecX [Rugosimonospora sp.]
MPGRRRGARTGRGWDAAPPRPRPARSPARGAPEEAPQEQASDPTEQAREICLRLLAVRPRTRAELATALRRQGVDDDVASAVLDRYDEVGMIDDAAFARAWVSSRHHGRGLARRALASELRQRGVDQEVVGAALEEVDADTEAATARELVDRRLRSAAAGTAPEVLLRRLVGVLARRGYPPGLAIRVVKEALADAADDRTASYAELLDPDASDLVGDPDDPIR